MKVIWNGITIESSANAGNLTYRIKVIIPKEKLSNPFTLNERKKNLFALDFSLKRAMRNDLIIVFDGSYITKTSGIDTSRCICHEKSTKNYHLKLKCWPSLYVFAKIKKKKQHIKKENSMYSLLTSSGNKPSSSKYINYKGNNSQNPYRGGSVTPK